MQDIAQPENGGKNNSSPEESVVLRSILVNQMTDREFFAKTWQQQAVVFPFSGGRPLAVGQGGDGSWNDEQMNENPLEEMVHQGWHILTRLLQQSEKEQTNNCVQSSQDEHQVPLVFQNRELQNQVDIQTMYGNSLFAPYLNGCSVVLNHGDLLSPWIADLCQDLQKSFPHAYANCYLTPPNSQAVEAHADDRDVLVFQLVGSKHWQVYQTVPVPYPYPHEQVGKAGMPVPKQVLDGPAAISTVLRPGDCMYMPRGFVHQARCSDSLSFHVTVALATHDWSLAGILSQATQSILTQTIDWRKSILPSPDPKALQSQIDLAIQQVRDEVTAEKVLANLDSKLEKHNRRALPLRMSLIQDARCPPQETVTFQDVVGPDAARRVAFTTIVRAATQEERARVPTNSTQPRGLNVREEIADSIMGIVSKIKSDPSIHCRVLDLRSLMPAPDRLVCDLALLSLAKRAVELGAVAIVN